MASFADEELKSDWGSYDLFRHGPVTLFYKSSVLDEAISHLEKHNYKVAQVDCHTVNTEANFYNAILFALGILTSPYKDIQPIQFWDSVTNITFGEEKGIVLALRHFDAIHSRFSECARDALQVLAQYQYRWLWFGHRYTTLVQTDNPELDINPVCDQEAHWNRESTSRKAE